MFPPGALTFTCRGDYGGGESRQGGRKDSIEVTLERGRGKWECTCNSYTCHFAAAYFYYMTVTYCGEVVSNFIYIAAEKGLVKVETYS